MSSEGFDVTRFLALRGGRALVWGEPLTYRRETGSTNEDALAAARAGAPDGSLFVAEYQSAGRGRRGRGWVGAAGQSLLFSVVARAEGEQRLCPASTLAVGLGVRAGLAAHCRARLRVKWPNDVVAEGGKLAGVLCEGQFEGQRAESLVIGVGINVGQVEFPPELRGTAVSLASLGSERSPPAREELLLEVLAAIESRVRVCWTAGFSPLLEEFRLHDALAGEPIEVDGARLRGIARGVDAEGQLLVETDGQIIPIHSGTVRQAAPTKT
jgi:BirA family biotin operon repressor/biotin-[acetyl-CoA-carboxylase] ligase